MIPPGRNEYTLFFVFQTVGDPSFGQVVRGQFDFDAIAGQNFNVVPPDLARNMGKHIEAIVEIHAEHSVRQGIHNGSFHLNQVLFRQCMFSRG
jgi:hypothetical protein